MVLVYHELTEGNESYNLGQNCSHGSIYFLTFAP